MKRTFAAVLFFAGCSAFAQVQSYRIPCSGLSSEVNPREDWSPALTTVEEPDGIAEDNNVEMKDSLAALYRHARPNAHPAQRAAAAPAAPVVNRNFAGNGFANSTPNDNEIAIANNGHLISVQNSTVFRRNTTTATNLGLQSLAAWCSVLGNTGSKYDPKVIYDPQADRFILVCLSGYLSGSTNIIIGFSRSDTANGLYNLYQLPGNPYSDSLWSDYPMVAVNSNELFVSVNLLHDNQSWQTGFVQTVIWQLNKWDGYNGDTLRTQLHGNIGYNNRPVRNLCPVEGGANTYPGPDMYFLSDRNLAAANDTVFLVHISDTANAIGQTVTVTPVISNRSYFMPPNAKEPGHLGDMATNDSRILGAFIQNNIIQFVNNTMDTSSGRCAIYHGMMSNVSTVPSLNANIIGDTALEFGYPNIAYTGYGASNDNGAIIAFLHSDSVTFPGFSAIVSDGNGLYSSRRQIKAGLNYINVLAGDERWGDYSGIQRKFDVGGTCWVNGMYGTTNNTHATWIAELGMGADVSVHATDPAVNEVSVYPNPFLESVSVVFRNEKTQRVRFVLYDINGKEAKVLLDDKVDEGKTSFTFSSGPLAAGIYLLRAEAADGSVLFTNRIVKQ